MALPLKAAHASETEDFESSRNIVKFTVFNGSDQNHAQKAELASFEEALLPHLDAAHNLARWLLRNEQDAEDVVQEAYLRAFKSFGGFHGSNGRAWLLTIVRNTSYTLLKKNSAADLTTTFDDEIHAPGHESVSRATILENSEDADPITSQKIEQHLRECPKCDQAYKIHGSLIRVIGNATPYYKAPAELREQIQSSLRDAVGAKDKGGSGQPGQLSVPRPQGERRPVLSHVPWNWLALAAAIMSGALITAVFLPRMRPPNADQFLATQLIASHVRSLMANHLMDVPSSDQHT